MSCHLRFNGSRETTTSIALFTFLGISSFVLAIFTVFANTLILHALRKCQTLHAPTKALFFSLAFSDLGVGLVVYPLFATYCFASILNNIEIFCAIRGPYTIAAYCFGSVSFLTMTAISLDRLFAFKLRFRYGHFLTFKRVVLLLAACWTFGLIWPFSWLVSAKVANMIAAMVIVFCATITSISYIQVAIGIRRHRRQIQEQQAIPARQQHGGNQFRICQYQKSLNTMILIFCLLIASYFPYLTVVVVTMVTGKNSSMLLVWNITSAFIYLNSLLNPFLYCWRIRELKREVLTVLPWFAR
ncbi:melanocyte-stimulating hormone receptor-like [Oculina patagonica]